MDTELLIWVAIFLGGYGVVLGWLLKIAMSKKPPAESPSE